VVEARVRAFMMTIKKELVVPFKRKQVLWHKKQAKMKGTIACALVGSWRGKREH